MSHMDDSALMEAEEDYNENDSSKLIGLDGEEIDDDYDVAASKDHGPDADKPGTPGEYARLIATIIKSFIGSGVLFLPKAFANGGWAFSVTMMALAAILTQICIMRLIKCREQVTGSYGMVGRKAVGKWGEVAVDVSLVLSQAGFGCVYIVFIARNVLQLLNTDKCWIGGNWLWLLILMEFALFWPLTLVRKISSFGPTNLAADGFIAVGLLGILAYSISGMVTDGHEGVAISVPAFNAQDWSLMLGTAVYAFEGIGMVVPVYDSLRPGLQRTFPRTLSATLFGVAAVYIIVGLVPLLYLDGMAHVPMQDAVTLNLPRVWWSYAIIGGYCLALTFSYPLMLFPAIRIIEKALMRGKLLGRDEDGFVARRNVVRAGIVAATLGVSLAGAEQLNNFVSLIGCFCCTPLAFIYPCLFHLKLVPKAPLWVRTSNWAIMVLGIGIFVFSTYQAIATWSVSPINPCLNQSSR